LSYTSHIQNKTDQFVQLAQATNSLTLYWPRIKPTDLPFFLSSDALETFNIS